MRSVKNSQYSISMIENDFEITLIFIMYNSINTCIAVLLITAPKLFAVILRRRKRLLETHKKQLYQLNLIVDDLD